MPASMPIASQLLLLVLVSILSSTHGAHIGQACTVDGSSGVCKRIEECPKIYNELLAGKLPTETCGYIGFEPIICCPTTNSVVTKPKPPPTTTPTPRPNLGPQTGGSSVRPPDNSRGSVARAVCAENAKAVYGFKESVALGLNQKLINVSLCALTTRKLIVGGTKADAKEFPHMAGIGFNGSDENIIWACGGSLISKRIVMTAAHCTWSAVWGNASWVRLGDLNLVETNDDAKPQTIAIRERIRHPNYRRPLEYNDIAILRLEKNAEYDEYVRPACLPVNWPDVGYDNEGRKNDKAVATGWGLVDWADDNGSEDLLKVTLRLVSHASCNTSFFDGGTSSQLASGINNDSQMCAGEVGKDTCQGDSGGPLAVFNNDHECMYNVIGITSLGRHCGSIIPGVYTRVYHYIPWIERTAWPEYFN